jgi:membrane fusion protein (multidrug efflux system)
MVKATIEDKKQKLHPGYFASVELSAIERAAVMVPEQALMKSLQGTIIYIIEDEKAKMIPITTGFRDSKGNIEVLTGVKEKDKVVIAGQMKIRDGASVSIITH